MIYVWVFRKKTEARKRFFRYYKDANTRGKNTQGIYKGVFRFAEHEKSATYALVMKLLKENFKNPNVLNHALARNAKIATIFIREISRYVLHYYL